jgi:4-hydroxy-2-oxoheptanedioate aldolase
MTGAELRTALRGGRRVYGTCIVSPSPSWAPMIASCGLDFVFIDTEHIPIDRAELSWMCRAYGAMGLPPVVRIPKPDAHAACMALDGGAQGVVAPYMETLEEVHALRGAVKYRPLKGARLERALRDPASLEPELRKYLETYNANNLCVVNVESVAAMEALSAILRVPDVDAVLVGPHDLSISLGVPEDYSHARFSAAMQTIIQMCRGAGIGVGYHFSFGLDIAMQWARMGANFIVHSTDLFLVRDALQREIGAFRKEFGEKPVTAGDGTGGGQVVV